MHKLYRSKLSYSYGAYLLFALLFYQCTSIKKTFKARTYVVGDNYLEYGIPFVPKDINPYDIIARVSFTNTETGEILKTQMFFDADSMKFRFSSKKPGSWNIKTSSKNPVLDGYKGTLHSKESEQAYNGFLSHLNNKWYWEGSKTVFVPQLVMGKPIDYYTNKTNQTEDIQEYLLEHQFKGIHIPSIGMGWFDLDNTGNDYTAINDNPNPDPETFKVLEQLIEDVYKSGGMLHFWLWGDESRKQTPIKWGINKTVDVRLQRYMAARLGAIPGWSASYGFDLPEWVTPQEVQIWHDNLQELLLHPHLLGARSGKHNMNPYSENLSYYSYEHHKPDYKVYLTLYNSRLDKPSFSEDRFRIRNRSVFSEKDYTEVMTIRGLWHSTMAGGIANIWGNLALPDGTSNVSYSLPYENKEAFRTYNQFFHSKKRYSNTFQPVSREDVNILIAKFGPIPSYIIYSENCESINIGQLMDEMPTKIKAVDIYREYNEIDVLVVAKQIQLPYKSDWALIIE